jgi:hypothetical protein
MDSVSVLREKPVQLDRIDRASLEIGTSPVDWARQSRLLPKDGNRVQSSKRF